MQFSSIPWEVAGAMVCNLLGSCISSFGVNLQKYAHFQRDQLGVVQGSYVRDRNWLLGFSVFIVGQIFIFLSFGFGPQTLLAVVGTVQLITNALFASYFFSEQFTRDDLYATAIIVGGASLAIVFDPHPTSRDYDIHDYAKYFTRAAFIVYAVCAGFALAVLFFVRYMRARHHRFLFLRRFRRHVHDTIIGHRDYEFGQAEQVTQQEYESTSINPTPERVYGSTGDTDVEVRDHEHDGVEIDEDGDESEQLPLLRAMSSFKTGLPPWLDSLYRQFPGAAFTYALIAAILGSFVSLFAKMVMQLLRSTVEGRNQFNDPLTYVVLFLFIVVAVTNIHFLNLGLQQAEVLLVVPTYYVFSLVLTVVGGVVYYQAYKEFDFIHGFFFTLAVVLTLLGILIISHRPSAARSRPTSTLSSPSVSPPVHRR